MRRRLSSRAYDPYDEWLESLGLYRKQLARDGSCLFRAVAEQVFMTQTEHERVRQQCLEYMVLHREEFEPFLDIPLDHHVYNLQDVREWGGHPEIIAMSRLFNVNFLIYREIGKEPYKATDNDGRTLMLSYTHGNHYDIVYKKESASSRGFSQSLIYDILYSQVFKLKDVRLAVDTMLHDKEYASFRRDSSNSAELKEIGALVEKILGTNISKDSMEEAEKNSSTEEKPSIEDIQDDDVRGLLAHGIPPFPYKVAKSLDPDIYRNIEYDTWNTVRKEARFGPYDYNGFQAGAKVLIKLELLPNRKEVEDMRRAHLDRSANGETNDCKPVDVKLDVFHGHIQEMSENKGPVDVYIEEIGSRLKVPYESLEKAPPSSPHAQGYVVSQQPVQPSGGPGSGGTVPNYKKLSGYYQKAPLPLESEYVVGKRKSKGKQREGPSHNSNMRGRPANSPTAVGQSPKSRGPGPHQSNYNRNMNRGYGRGNNYGNSGSPSREDFPSFSSSSNLPVGLEGVWAMRPSADNNHSMVASTPKANTNNYYPSTPQPPMTEDETRLQIQAVTDALQQVMSAGGQTVRVSGQQLEVVNNEYNKTPPAPAQQSDETTECNVSTQEVDEKAQVPLNTNAEPFDNSANHIPPPPPPPNCVGSEPVPNQGEYPHFTEGNSTQPVFYPPDSGLAYISTPPPALTQQQITGTTSPHIPPPMYTVAYPSYNSPTYVQMITPVPPSEGSVTPSELTPPPPSENVDGNNQGSNSDIMKVNPGMTPVMVYQVPVMYSGYGYGYNQPYQYGMPIMSTPTNDNSKIPPVQGNEMYPTMVPVSGWGPPPFMGDGVGGGNVPPPHVPVPPPNIPTYPREPPVPPFPPPPLYHERPPYHHHRGRGRGGPHHYNHQNRGYHHDGMGRGGGQRPLPPRLRRGGGGPPGGRGGPRFPLHAMNNNNGPPGNFQRSHQYEGQPLMQMGARKSSAENLVVQGVPGNCSSGVSSPPLVTNPEERPPDVYTLNPQDGSQLQPQDPVSYYPTPPGYVVGPPWMWMSMM